MENRRTPLQRDAVLQEQYKIKEVISQAGATCLVYKAHPILEDNTVDMQNPLIIKEFYPINWSVERIENKVVPQFEFLQDTFQEEVDNFCSQIEFNNASGYNEENDARYMTFLHMSSFKENGTGYIVIGSVNGSTLDGVLAGNKENTVHDREGFMEQIDIMTCVADTLLIQHKAGFLNLDLKADNLLISKIGSSWLATILDFGSCFPLEKHAISQASLEKMAMRISQTKGYSSERLKNVFRLAEKNWKRNKETIEAFAFAIEKLSPADDVYSLCRIFQKMIFDRIDEDYRDEVEKLDWLNQVERDFLFKIFEEGLDVDKEHTTEDFLEWLKQLKDILSRDSSSKKSLEDSIAYTTELAFDMSKVQAFSECGSAGSVFKINQAEGDEIAVDVSFEPTRTRKEFPKYAGVYYKKLPVADIRALTKIEFEACSIGDGLAAMQVEIKPKGFRWMHEIFPVKLTNQYEKHTILTNDFQNPATLGCVEEITFVMTPDHFRDEDLMKGSFMIRNLKIK